MCVQFTFLEPLIIEVVISVAPLSQPTITCKLQSVQEGLDIVITVDASYNFSHKRKSLYNFALMPQLQHKYKRHSKQLIQKKR
jgi:mannose/fructose/N-acetylgalactosamine-specific phosphotransferase system component IID